MRETIDKKLRLGDLYELYARLLTEKQREILDQYCMEDLSLAEISENLGISRQAVFDTVRKAERQMEDLETALGLREQARRRKQHLEQALLLLETWRPESDSGQACVMQLKGILTDCLES